MNKNIEVIDLGKMDYESSWDFQEHIFSQTLKRKSNNHVSTSPVETENKLIFVEHPPVYTLGKSGHLENLLMSEKQLRDIGASFYKINRGGDITFHGPGQLVGYPILDLENFFTDIHKYLRYIEEAVICTLSDFGIPSGRCQGETGVWIDPGKPSARKICAIGVRASRWVTMHGFALNITTDLGYFDHIVPCGIYDKGVTSMAKELGKVENETLLFEDVKGVFLGHFIRLFEAILSIKKTEVLPPVL